MTQGGRINSKIAVAVVLLGLIALSGIVYYMVLQARIQPQYFHPVRRALGQRLLAEVREYDLVNDYPQTPEEVMHLHNLLYRLIYGQIVVDQDLIWELVGIQRQLYSEELLILNSHESQFQEIIEATTDMFASNIFLFAGDGGIDVGITFYSTEADDCYVPLTLTMINHERMFWNYFLKLYNGRWKIHRFIRTDATFLNEYVED